MHRDTKIAIQNYVADNDCNPVKPTILVYCKDATHAKHIFNYVTSGDLYDGEFKEKACNYAIIPQDKIDINRQNLIELTIIPLLPTIRTNPELLSPLYLRITHTAVYQTTVNFAGVNFQGQFFDPQKPYLSSLRLK